MTVLLPAEPREFFLPALLERRLFAPAGTLSFEADRFLTWCLLEVDSVDRRKKAMPKLVCFAVLFALLKFSLLELRLRECWPPAARFFVVVREVG